MEKIESQLKRLTPELSMHESQVLWSRVEGKLSPRGAKSPKPAKRSIGRAVTAGLVIVGLLGGSVVTAYASESLPGDALYPTKLTIERAQIVLASAPKKKELQLAFADRRVKEVSAVLADIEEESSVPEETVEESDISITGTPSAEAIPMMLTVDTITPSTELPEAPQPTVATFAMNASAPHESEEEDHQTESPRTMGARSKFSAPVPMILKTEVAPSSLEGGVAPMQMKQAAVAQKGKRWKNLDGKKRALTIAIRELERSRKELRENGATSTSDRVDEVIVSLTELNTTGTTADDTFVEKMKNSEVEVLHVEDEDKDKKGEREDEEKKDESNSPSLLSPPEPLSQEVSVVLALEAEASQETEKEIEEVKVRNVERKKRFQAQVINIQSREKVGIWRGGKQVNRVPVCFDSGKAMREILVPEKDTSKYLEHGFTRGVCPSPATSTLPIEE